MSKTNREKRREKKKKARERRVHQEVYAEKGGGSVTSGAFKPPLWAQPAWRRGAFGRR